MKFWLNNIGIIKNSDVLLDGLTVITGKNSSGKTTVGKALYAIIQANSDIENAFEKSKSAYISSQLGKIWMALSSRRNYTMRLPQSIDELNEVEHVLLVLSRRPYNKASLDTLLTWLYLVKDILPKLTLRELNSFLEKTNPYYDHEREYYLTLSAQFEERKENAIEICNRAISTIDDPQAFHAFRRERTRSFLNLAFRNQIKPIRASRTVAQIKLTSSDRLVLGMKIRSKSNFDFSSDSSFVFPVEKAIFVDDPFVLDSFEYDDIFLRSSYQQNADDIIGAVDIMSHREHLKKLLTTTASFNFFDNLEFQKMYKEIIEKINLIVPGEFQKSSDGMFYIENGARLNVQNLATGSKLFFIIKILFMNGFLDKNTVLILDEPESHLHPEWINKFAEILVLLMKELKIHVLLTTHSPNLLLALSVYSNAYSVSELSHFYLAKTMENSWTTSLSCIDNNINEGYAHLSIPLIEMTIQQDSLAER